MSNIKAHLLPKEEFVKEILTVREHNKSLLLDNAYADIKNLMYNAAKLRYDYITYKSDIQGPLRSEFISALQNNISELGYKVDPCGDGSFMISWAVTKEEQSNEE